MAAIVSVVWHRTTDQWRRIENLEIDPYKYVQMMFEKDVEVIQWKKDSLSANAASVIEHSCANKNELQPTFTPYTKIKVNYRVRCTS